jgi:hypothetical protein
VLTFIVRRYNSQIETGSGLSGARWFFRFTVFELARDDVGRTRAFFALSDLELHLLAFIKSGITFSLDFRVMNE